MTVKSWLAKIPRGSSLSFPAGGLCALLLFLPLFATTPHNEVPGPVSTDTVRVYWGSEPAEEGWVEFPAGWVGAYHAVDTLGMVVSPVIVLDRYDVNGDGVRDISDLIEIIDVFFPRE